MAGGLSLSPIRKKKLPTKKQLPALVRARQLVSNRERWKSPGVSVQGTAGRGTHFVVLGWRQSYCKSCFIVVGLLVCYCMFILFFLEKRKREERRDAGCFHLETENMCPVTWFAWSGCSLLTCSAKDPPYGVFMCSNLHSCQSQGSRSRGAAWCVGMSLAMLCHSAVTGEGMDGPKAGWFCPQNW